MNFVEEFKHKLFEVNEKTLQDSSLAAFDYQYSNSDIYQTYCKFLGKSPKNVKKITEIPFLPIELFKNHAIKSGDWEAEKIFKSSGTTATGRSEHHISDLDFYHETAKKTFESHFGSLSEYRILAILPSYQEQGDSSLISMVDYFMTYSQGGSGYFLNNDINNVLSNEGKNLIIGVSYALLDLTESHIKSHESIVMETGGMKGRRKEMTRTELHTILKNSFDTSEIWSEYGMTELQSQGYGKNGHFHFPPWAKCLVRDINDPFSYLPDHSTGGINVIDLANIETCCFIETKDLGRLNSNTFEVLGRFDNSDIRGCNLMI